ncbi:MAG TPA: (2Fe-2S)-binding protein [Porticoccaceae bacterium]|nr:(2Fe-2S)-binding protein [Porticoccaceae bacterium]
MSESITLCRLDAIPVNGCKGFVLDRDCQLFAVRTQDNLFLYRNICPHAGFELNWQPDKFLDRSGQYILCAAHGATFDITSGACVAGPCAGASLTSVPYIISDGEVRIGTLAARR